MAMNSSGESLRTALELDLQKGSPGGGATVQNDAARKLFTFRRDGVVFEFAHRQPDEEYWNGVKYYGSGSHSRVRIRRTPTAVEKAAPASKTRRASTSRKKKAAPASMESPVEVAVG